MLRKIPMNLLVGLAAGCLTALIAALLHPGDTGPFYSAAVQVVPVFLVAVALERTLVETLGTESSVLAEEQARVDREWTPPSRMTRTYYTIGLRLRDLRAVSIPWNRVDAIREELRDLTPTDISRALPDEEPTDGDFQSVVETLAALVPGERTRFRRGQRRVGPPDLLVEWDRLQGALTDTAKERAVDEVRYIVSTLYRERRSRQRMSVLASVATLAAAEILAFVGLLSPAAPYPGLFGATAGAVAASFIAVTSDALLNLFAPDVDVQSAGLNWTSKPVGSHWKAL